MANYQLYRSNVLLGGQMKYDLILGNIGGDLEVTDFHITPISNSVPYNKKVKDNLLNYSHQENIKDFYKSISGSFYNDFANPLLTSLYPLSNDYNGEKSDTTYEMGCRRMNYKLYRKQFNFFCPIWLEKISDFKQLSFEIQIFTDPEQSSPITVKTLSFNENHKEYQVNLIKYFNEYIKFTKLDKGYDWVFNISPNNCNVTGLNVKNGIMAEYDILHLYQNLTSRERPLLEFNNMIINELRNRYLITRQLFNFNLCFNIEDLMSSFEFKSLKTQNLYISVIIKDNNKELDLVDLYSNHEYIPKTYTNRKKLKLNNDKLEIEDVVENKSNVLDYLQDYNYIDLIDKDKIIQSTCHWCLSSHPEEHFNLYGGFSPNYYLDLEKDEESKEISIQYYNGDTANLSSKILTNSTNNDWCNIYEVNDKVESNNNTIITLLNSYISNFEQQEVEGLVNTFFDNCWIKNINYKYKNEAYKDKQINVIVIQDNNLEGNYPYYDKQINLAGWSSIQYHDSDNTGDDADGKNFYCIVPPTGNLIIFLFDEDCQKFILYKNFIKSLDYFEKYLKDSNLILIKYLKDILSNPQQLTQSTITFQNGLMKRLAHSPSLSSKEINYYKTNSHQTLIRNFGQIKPMFVKKNSPFKNYIHYKKTIIELQKDQKDYNKYLGSKYKPIYPSIGYFSFNHIEEQYVLDDYVKGIEYHKYNYNRIFYLYPEIIYTVETDPANLDNEVKKYLEEIYSYKKIINESEAETQNKETFQYILQLYEPSVIETIYHDNSESQKYKYTVQIKLK